MENLSWEMKIPTDEVAPCCGSRIPYCTCDLTKLSWVARAGLRLGLLRGYGSLRSMRGPISVLPWWLWKAMFRQRSFFGLFRNRPNVISKVRGSLLPRRWGFHILGLEIGQRG